jgi:uncharacterized protein YqeY
VFHILSRAIKEIIRYYIVNKRLKSYYEQKRRFVVFFGIDRIFTQAGTIPPARYNETMELKVHLETALKDAMKAGDDVRKRTIRMVLAAIRQVEIDRQLKLDEPAVLSIIQKEIKTRKEAVEEARGANRLDIVIATEAEIKVLQGYLPEALSEEELGVLAKAVIVETAASSPADMGKVMKLLMPRVAGRATGDQVSNVVRQILQK